MRPARRQAGNRDRVRFGNVVTPGGVNGGCLRKPLKNALHARSICGWHQLAAFLCRLYFKNCMPTLTESILIPIPVPIRGPRLECLRFRRAWRLFRFGNTHSPSGASCNDSGAFLLPQGYRSPLVRSLVRTVKLLPTIGHQSTDDRNSRCSILHAPQLALSVVYSR